MGSVKFTVPKGSLEKETFSIIRQAWFKLSGELRTYRPVISDPEIELKILRPQEIPYYVSEGLQDVGITGKDWIRESRSDVKVLLDLEYGRVKLVLAIPEQSPYSSLDDLLKDFAVKKKTLRLSTEYLNIASDYLRQNPTYRKLYGKADPVVITPWWRKGSVKQVNIFLSFGATEAKPPENADAILDLTETGATLEQNNLKVIETIMHSSAVLISNKKALNDPLKREKIYDIISMLKGVVNGRKKLHIFVNVRKENLKKLLSQLPALKNPTISPLSDEDWYSVNTVIDKKLFFKLIPVLRKLAQGLVVHEPLQILPLEEIVKGAGHEKASHRKG